MRIYYDSSVNIFMFAENEDVGKQIGLKGKGCDVSFDYLLP